MDWKLTKSLYILVFLIINLALIFMFYNKQQDSVKKIEDAPSVLEKTDIDVSGLPEHEPMKLNVLTAETEDFEDIEEAEASDIESSENSNSLTVEFEEGDAAPWMDPESLEQYKTESIYRGGDYEYDEMMSKENRRIFNQHFEGLPIFNHESARLIFRGEGPEAEVYEQAYLKNLRENSYSTPAAVRNPKEGVIDLYQRDRISEEAVVENARLGYYVILNEGDQVMLRPKWEFRISDQGVEKTIYIDAISETEDIIESE
ncbi:MAG TPA: two-component system regulatory protein YycI [Candidatus Salinicoccus stercoripullorum]|uniref:Two-component system regulatory protein YycI n=1 Tax=Candidatus Salinicoccus stercoripullorum TaxID=2838756 RepID=A0A9D1QIJ8_9STAP|nr:two-component system regulatory protein YycI [Candidatus Salinicoccus stercoripullorum]